MNTPISMETVDMVWQRMAELSEEEATHMIQQMEREQPELQTYLLAVDDEFEEDEAEIIFYLGVVAWQMMKQGGRRMGKITEAQIDKVDELNFTFFNNLSEDEQNLEVVTMKMLEEYPEPNVLGYVINALMDDEDPEDPGIRDELVGLAFLHLKTAVDAMIASQK